MSDNESSYSPFWPILILLIGLVLFEGYQVIGLYTQGSSTNQVISQATPQLNKAVGAHNKLLAVAQDVYALSQKGDPAATELVNKFQIRPNQQGTATAPPAPSK